MIRLVVHCEELLITYYFAKKRPAVCEAYPNGAKALFPGGIAPVGGRINSRNGIEDG
jgi:hypothetical protein